MESLIYTSDLLGSDRDNNDRIEAQPSPPKPPKKKNNRMPNPIFETVLHEVAVPQCGVLTE
jgi:hypothetical protein